MIRAILRLFCRQRPTTFSRCLAVHVWHATNKGTLR